jgi:hypothetical protein
MIDGDPKQRIIYIHKHNVCTAQTTINHRDIINAESDNV